VVCRGIAAKAESAALFAAPHLELCQCRMRPLPAM
jgi:hypothetical protein